MPQNRNNNRGRNTHKTKQQAPSRSSGSGGSEQQSLQGREYRDEKGEIHHHTKTYMEQHRDRER